MITTMVTTLDDDNDDDVDNNDQVYTSDHQLAIRTARSLAAASGFSRTHIIGFIQQIKSSKETNMFSISTSSLQEGKLCDR